MTCTGTGISMAVVPSYNFTVWVGRGNLQRELLDAAGKEGKNPILNNVEWQWGGPSVEACKQHHHHPTARALNKTGTKANPPV